MPTSIETKARNIDRHLPEMMCLAHSSGLPSIILPFGTFDQPTQEKLRDLVAEYAKGKGHKTRKFLHQTRLYLEVSI